MTFFFQTNPIRVILKMVLALLSSIIAVGGCFCSTVQKTSNKVRVSIIKLKRKVFIMFGIWIFFLQKHMDSLQEAFVHAPEPCEARFIMDACILFDVFWTVKQKHPPTAMITLEIARTIFYITLIGFVWKKKVIYTRMPRGLVKHMH